MDEKALLTKYGVAPTPLRISIIRLLNNSSVPLSYEDLIKELDVHKTTIYRNLTTLEESDIIIKTENDKRAYWALHEEAKAYFVCERCHKIEEVSMPKLDFKDVKSITIKGICDECKK